MKRARFLALACAAVFYVPPARALEDCNSAEAVAGQKSCISRNIEAIQAELKEQVLAKCRSEATADGGGGSGVALETLACAEQRFSTILQEAR